MPSRENNSERFEVSRFQDRSESISSQHNIRVSKKNFNSKRRISIIDEEVLEDPDLLVVNAENDRENLRKDSGVSLSSQDEGVQVLINNKSFKV